jgi:hypothetical protein
MHFSCGSVFIQVTMFTCLVLLNQLHDPDHRIDITPQINTSCDCACSCKADFIEILILGIRLFFSPVESLQVILETKDYKRLPFLFAALLSIVIFFNIAIDGWITTK